MNKLLLLSAVAVVATGCGGSIGNGDGDGGPGGGGGGSSTGGGGGTTGGGGGGMVSTDGGLPCDVVALINTHCVSCHGAPVSGNAPMTLMTRDDFAAVSAIDATKNLAERSLLRMQAGTMPPGGGVPQALINSFSAWIGAGLTGSCSEPVDAGVVTPTCASTTYQPTPSNFNGSSRMAPGMACIACHRGQNFNGQNPSGLSEPGRVYQFMGTVFASAHEKDLCNPGLPTAAQVEIYNSSGTKVLTLPVNSGGNFFGSVATGMPSPYTAKVVTSAGSRAMVGAQTNGDCNVCHTALGEQGAPGRIYLP